MAHDDEQAGQVGVAYVVLVDGGGATAESLLAHTRERLRGYMAPASVHFVEWLPKNPAGKVLKERLRGEAAV